MRDAAQAGGVNPSMQDDMLWFNFRTGRLPRKVTSRGDCKYLIEHGGSEEQKYLKVGRDFMITLLVFLLSTLIVVMMFLWYVRCSIKHLYFYRALLMPTVVVVV